MALKPGFTMSLVELHTLGVEPSVGARFTTDKLDVRVAEFEVLSVEGLKARVQRIAWVPRQSGITPAAPIKRDRIA